MAESDDFSSVGGEDGDKLLKLNDNAYAIIGSPIAKGSHRCCADN